MLTFRLLSPASPPPPPKSDLTLTGPGSTITPGDNITLTTAAWTPSDAAAHPLGFRFVFAVGPTELPLPGALYLQPHASVTVPVPHALTAGATVRFGVYARDYYGAEAGPVWSAPLAYAAPAAPAAPAPGTASELCGPAAGHVAWYAACVVQQRAVLQGDVFAAVIHAAADSLRSAASLEQVWDV